MSSRTADLIAYGVIVLGLVLINLPIMLALRKKGRG